MSTASPLSCIARLRPRGRAVSISSSGLLHRAASALALLVAACRPVASTERAAIVVDDAGDTVRVTAPARRVVSLIPATTELLFAIGAGPLLVGRTAWCDYPPAAAAVPNLGDGIAPNAEAVLASRTLVTHMKLNTRIQRRDHEGLA